MSETPISLLEKLRLGPDSAAWRRLVDLYTPLIRTWLRRQSLPEADVDDLVQEVLGLVVQELGNFRHNRQRGAFRRWLRTITVNQLRRFWRGLRARPLATGDSDFQHFLDQLEDPESSLSRLWEQEHDQYGARRLLELLEPEFEPTTWKAFQLLVIEGQPAAEVAARLGISPNAARIAKSRVLNRFRREIDGLID